MFVGESFRINRGLLVVSVLGLLIAWAVGCTQFVTSVNTADEEPEVLESLESFQNQTISCIQILTRQEASREAFEAFKRKETQELRFALLGHGKKVNMTKVKGCIVKSSIQQDASNNQSISGKFLKISAGKGTVLNVLKIGNEYNSWASLQKTNKRGEIMVFMEPSVKPNSKGAINVNSLELLLPEKKYKDELVAQVKQLLENGSYISSVESDAQWQKAEAIIDERAKLALIMLPTSASPLYVQVSMKSSNRSSALMRPDAELLIDGETPPTIQNGEDAIDAYTLCPYSYSALYSFRPCPKTAVKTGMA